MDSSNEDISEDIQVDRKIKITIVGDGGVGKTCLMRAFVERRFYEEYIPTVFDSHVFITEVDNEIVKVTLWDTAGQEDYARLRGLSYPGTNAYILCYSVASSTSYDNASSVWYPEVKHFSFDKPVVLVGTKTDIRDESGCDLGFVTTSQGQRLAKQIKAVDFQECSAKGMENINTVIDKAVRAAIKRTPKPPRRGRPGTGFCLIL